MRSSSGESARVNSQRVGAMRVVENGVVLLGIDRAFVRPEVEPGADAQARRP